MYIALYARQSIERENSISIETQLEYCKGMIRPDEKLYNVKSFSDKGYSGKDTNRPDFQRLMKDIRRGKVKKVIVYKLDRVSRSLIDFVDMLAEFKKYNVEFISSQECFDTSSPYGEMVLSLYMVLIGLPESLVLFSETLYMSRLMQIFMITMSGRTLILSEILRILMASIIFSFMARQPTIKI